MYRTHTCGELNIGNVSQRVKLAGWLESVRDLGSVVFFVVRDFYGVTQVVASSDEMMAKIREISRESTVQISGTVIERSNPNPNIPTGLIEIEPDDIKVLGKCFEILPFQISTSNESKEETRLKYRFLDLRNPTNKEKIILRSNIIYFLRNKMMSKGFYEIQTPILTSSSPEGARDYLVPSRIHPGKFYALPQAPQQFKQLLMVSGIDRYFQIAPCFRDEDARADRSPGEFYQLDMEMAFAEQEDIFAVVEDVLTDLFTNFSNWSVNTTFPRIKYKDAIEKYGSDKPDLRNPLVVCDATEMFKDIEIAFFKDKVLKAVAVDNFDKSRKFIDEITKKIRDNDGDGLAWLKVDADGNLVGSIAKYIPSDKADAITKSLGLKRNSAAMFIADERKKAEKLSGILRNELGKALDLIKGESYEFCWIVDFPMYELNDETGEIEFSHNPFSMPQGGLDALKSCDPLSISAYQYDVVCNGIELSSGAVRNHDPEIMLKAFEIAGYPESVIQTKFPALYNAFRYGAPPHAGIAPGIDRMVMLLANEPNIREVIAFPMNKNAQDLLMGAPAEVTQKQLDELKLRFQETKEN